ncbi:hypothetical protein [Hasllibacter sp. MH4015]|uniref:hypothetical protein n=1 Tax=Hasllibacter sp. MH4015 TaxID=2854029 RepID=UPI001CD4D80C|nr:hypothetical protein [Hasllibacter sp. MH4015]
MSSDDKLIRTSEQQSLRVTQSEPLQENDDFVRMCIEGNLDCTFVWGMRYRSDGIFDTEPVIVDNMVLELAEYLIDGKREFEFLLQYGVKSKQTRSRETTFLDVRLLDEGGVVLEQEFSGRVFWRCDENKIERVTGSTDGNTLNTSRQAEFTLMPIRAFRC